MKKVVVFFPGMCYGIKRVRSKDIYRTAQPEMAGRFTGI